MKEKNIDLVKQKENYDKSLLRMETIIGLATLIMYLTLVMVVSFAQITDWITLSIITIATVYLLIICFVLLKIEQIAGYYECRKCHHKYVPTFKSVLWAMHIGRTRYMECPECEERSWNKKVLSK